jgi:hypothetical protein
MEGLYLPCVHNYRLQVRAVTNVTPRDTPLLPVPGKDSYVRIGIFYLRSRDVNNVQVQKRFTQEDIQTVKII